MAHRAPARGPADTAVVGRYSGRIDTAEGRTRRFRLLLFAELPDRFHGEVLPPVGGPRLIVDGGGGRLAVTFVRDGESFVGSPSREVLEQVLGVPVDLEQLVRALLRGEGVGEDLRVDRTGPPEPGLPERLVLAGGNATLALELKRLRPLAVDRAPLGTGQPPAGTRVRPIEELSDAGGGLEAWEDGEATGS